MKPLSLDQHLKNPSYINKDENFENFGAQIKVKPTCTYTPKFVRYEIINSDNHPDNPRVVPYEEIDRVI